jgi:hypothetical protein
MFCKVPPGEEEDSAPELDMSPNCAADEKKGEVVRWQMSRHRKRGLAAITRIDDELAGSDFGTSTAM